MKKRLIVLVSFFALMFSSIGAEEKFSLLGSKDVFSLNPVTDSLLLGAGISLCSTDIVLDKVVHLNQTDFFGAFTLSVENVNAFDRFFMKDYSKSLDYLSTGLEALSVLTPLVLLGTSKSEWFTIGAMYSETILFAYGFKELGKLLVNRARPYSYFWGTYPLSKLTEGDWNDSFFSGHSTLSFAAATFTSYAFCKYFPDSKWKIPVVVLSYTLASATSVLRVMSGNHFATDVIVGAAIGTATGFLVPFLHTLGLNGNINSKVSASIMPTGVNFEIKL